MLVPPLLCHCPKAASQDVYSLLGFCILDGLETETTESGQRAAVGAVYDASRLFCQFR